MAEQEKQQERQEKQRKPRAPREERSRREDDGIDKNLVAVRRVTKVVKGGRTLRFSAVVVVGDHKGNVGMGTGKAKEVPTAIDKATMNAKKNMRPINIVNGTIPHEIIGKYGTSKFTLFQPKKVLESSQVVVLVPFWNLPELKTLSPKFMVPQTKSTQSEQR